MSDGILEEFGFGQGDEAIGVKTKKFKAKQDEKYRISFVNWPGSLEGKPDLDAPTPKFLGGKRLYLQSVGYFLDKGPEFVKVAGEASKMQIATLICVWPTDSSGGLDKDRFAANRFSVMPWVFSADKYKNIASNHQEFPLGSHDLNLHCTDAQFQKITMSPCRESLFRKLLEKDPARAKIILDQTRELIPTLASEIAQDLTIEQVREKIQRNNGGGGGGGGASRSPTGGGTAQSSKDFDDMLGDILG